MPETQKAKVQAAVGDRRYSKLSHSRAALWAFSFILDYSELSKQSLGGVPHHADVLKVFVI